MSGRTGRPIFRRGLLALTLFLVTAGCEECLENELSTLPVPDDQIDLFTQKQAAQVDILWVVDNSGSMAAEQAKIANRFSEFFRQLIVSQVDYHIGVITTDPDEDGVLRSYDGPAVTGCEGCRYITNNVPCANPSVDVSNLGNAEAEQRLAQECQAQLVFRKLVSVGIDGSAFEEGFPQAARALGAATVDRNTGFPVRDVPTENAGFLRDAASLYIVFVSDEDEGAKQDGSPVSYYKRLFEGLKSAGNENMVSVSAITGWSQAADAPALDDVCGILLAGNDPRETQVREIMSNPLNGCFDETGLAGDENAFAEAGGRYIELACRTGGVVSNMCQADYSTALGSLGANAAGLLRKFSISKPEQMDKGADCRISEYGEPDSDDPALDCDLDGEAVVGDDEDEVDGPLCVSARAIGSPEGSETLIPRGPVGNLNGWYWDDATNSVRFGGNFVPAPGSEVTITYKLRLPGALPCQ